MGSHRGILTGFEQFGLGEAVVAVDRFINEPVDLASHPSGGPVGAADPLGPGLDRLAFAMAQIDAAGGIEEVVAFIGPGSLVIITRM